MKILLPFPSTWQALRVVRVTQTNENQKLLEYQQQEIEFSFVQANSQISKNLISLKFH
jgi:hypothetical protein